MVIIRFRLHAVGACRLRHLQVTQITQGILDKDNGIKKNFHYYHFSVYFVVLTNENPYNNVIAIDCDCTIQKV